MYLLRNSRLDLFPHHLHNYLVLLLRGKIRIVEKNGIVSSLERIGGSGAIDMVTSGKIGEDSFVSSGIVSLGSQLIITTPSTYFGAGSDENLSSASGITTVPMSRPSMTTPFCCAKILCCATR